MRIKTQIRRVFQLVFVLTLAGILASCNSGPSSASADATKNSGPSTGGLFDRTKPAPKVTIPAGTRLRVALVDGVSTTDSSSGDQFVASLSEPVIVGGKMVLEKGTKVLGRVVDVQESGRVKGRASIQLALTEVMPNGKSVSISTKPYIAIAEANKKRDAGIIVGGVGIGTAIGAIAGGKKGAAIGAAVGGGAGTGTVLATKGKELHYPSETRLSFSLANPVEI